jgi:hypothetical protein
MVICCFFCKGVVLLPEDEADSAQMSVFTHQITCMKIVIVTHDISAKFLSVRTLTAEAAQTRSSGFLRY